MRMTQTLADNVAVQIYANDRVVVTIQEHPQSFTKITIPINPFDECDIDISTTYTIYEADLKPHEGANR